MKYPAYPRKTEFEGLENAIAPGWEQQRLKFVASCNDEVLAEDTDEDQEISYVEISGVDLERGVHTVEQLSFGEAPSRARRIARHGDTLVSTVRTYLRAIAYVQNPPENLVVSTGFAVLRPSNVLIGRFLGYALQSSKIVDAVVANSTGVSYQSTELKPVKYASR